VTSLKRVSFVIQTHLFFGWFVDQRDSCILTAVDYLVKKLRIIYGEDLLVVNIFMCVQNFYLIIVFFELTVVELRFGIPNKKLVIILPF